MNLRRGEMETRRIGDKYLCASMFCTDKARMKFLDKLGTLNFLVK